MEYVFFLLLVYLVLLWLKSKNEFFKQGRENLAIKRLHLIKVLEDFNIDVSKDKRWLKSYDIFCSQSKYYRYDGATIVKDIPTIKRYDAPAGNHDVAYIELRWFCLSGFINKFKIDYQYGLDMRKLDIAYTTAWSRVLLLWVSTPFWYVFLLCKKIKKTF